MKGWIASRGHGKVDRGLGMVGVAVQRWIGGEQNLLELEKRRGGGECRR